VRELRENGHAYNPDAGDCQLVDVYGIKNWETDDVTVFIRSINGVSETEVFDTALIPGAKIFQNTPGGKCRPQYSQDLPALLAPVLSVYGWKVTL
jgi:hypothetical protein